MERRAFGDRRDAGRRQAMERTPSDPVGAGLPVAAPPRRFGDDYPIHGHGGWHRRLHQPDLCGDPPPQPGRAVGRAHARLAAVEGRFTLILVVLKTLDDQLRCFQGVARRLTDDGVFVLDAFVPDVTRFDRGQLSKRSTRTSRRLSTTVRNVGLRCSGLPAFDRTRVRARHPL